MRSAPSAERVFSPLDEELGLLPGTLTPSLVEGAVRLGTWMPFGMAAKMLEYFTKVKGISEPTVCRVTERAGQAYVEVQTEQLEVLERELPESPAGPAMQLLSADGAMVPLRGKDEWAEVKTLAIGTVEEPVFSKKKEWEIHVKDLSYFSRLADHETFERLATVEIHRRGTEKAGVVCAVMDGALWEQGFVDLHRADAVRILDFSHGAGYVVQAGQAMFGIGNAAFSEWIGIQLHELRHGEPEKVLDELREYLKKAPQVQGEGETLSGGFAVVRESLEYLEKRKEQIRYAEFEAKGYPVGSGAVESANKLVVEARLKGSGMHWAREHVSPMVALRTIACNDRWEEAWLQISGRLCQQVKERSQQRRAMRRAETKSITAAVLTAQENEEPGKESVTTLTQLEMSTTPVPTDSETTTRSSIPSASHPWRRARIGKAIWAGPRPTTTAKS